MGDNASSNGSAISVSSSNHIPAHGNNNYDNLLTTLHNSNINSIGTSVIGRRNAAAGQTTLVNFILMSIYFSANHGCVVACLSLATARLGSTGAWQSAILYFTYTMSAILGATYFVKRLGARNALVGGMLLYCVYVGCFLVATLLDDNGQGSATIGTTYAAGIGGAIGGIGAGFLWTAQGTYFGRASEEYSQYTGKDIADSNSKLAGIFAFIYLMEEVVLRLLSSFLIEIELSWSLVFGLYTTVAILSTFFMSFVRNYHSSESDNNSSSDIVTEIPATIIASETESSSVSLTREINNADNNNHADYQQQQQQQSIWYKLTASYQILRNDPKMKYMIGLNSVFGLTSAFLNSYVNGEVIPVVLQDDSSKTIGLFTAHSSIVAAIMSFLFGTYLSPRIGNGPILIFGAVCFFGVVSPFVIEPNANQWNWGWLLLVYTLHGMGRATFEGTLKATFADFFPDEKEGAFANIILQNGLSGTIGYGLTFSLLCTNLSDKYCIQYRDGSFHDVLSFELICIVSAIVAIVGYWRASILRNRNNRNETVTRTSNGIIT